MLILRFHTNLHRYVAMHAMQEDSGHDHSTSNGYLDGGASQRNKSKPQMKDTFWAVLGMLVPLVTQVFHHH
jgi:zinc transporter 9